MHPDVNDERTGDWGPRRAARLSSLPSMKREAIDEFTRLCEACGYVIEGIDEAGRCSECGKPVAESLPERRVGTPWQRERTFSAFVATALMVLARPWRTLEVVRPEQPRTRRFGNRVTVLAAHVAGLALSIALMFGLPRGAAAWLAPLTTPGLAMVLVAPTIFLLTMVEQRGLLTLSAVHGSRLSAGYARAICGHGSVGWFIASVLGGGFGVLALVAYNNRWSSIMFGQWFNWPVIFAVLAAAGMLGGFLFFEWFAWLGLRRLRYANTAPRGATSADFATKSTQSTEGDAR